VAELKIGVVTHYYDNIHTAIIDLSAPLHAGDRVRFTGSIEFNQLVETMQVEHEQITAADKGDTVGLIVKLPVTPGDEVVKISF
jgi:hypothetical protein